MSLPPLLSIAPELRVQIYEYVFGTTATTTLHLRRRRPLRCGSQRMLSLDSRRDRLGVYKRRSDPMTQGLNPRSLRLLATCRLIHHEAQHVFYARRRWIVDACDLNARDPAYPEYVVSTLDLVYMSFGSVNAAILTSVTFALRTVESSRLDLPYERQLILATFRELMRLHAALPTANLVARLTLATTDPRCYARILDRQERVDLSVYTRRYVLSISNLAADATTAKEHLQSCGVWHARDGSATDFPLPWAERFVTLMWWIAMTFGTLVNHHELEQDTDADDEMLSTYLALMNVHRT
jgi:hypothetical protein